MLTVSDSRSEADDTSGQHIERTLTDAGHTVVLRRIVKDDPDQINDQLHRWIDDPKIDVICCTGGTGVGRRDTTTDVVDRLLQKKLDGFGELFRMLSWHQIGAAAMLSRAVAGLVGRTVIFVMPGSTKAVALAMEKLILPELPHLVWVMRC